MKFPVFSLLAGNLAFSETSSQLSLRSSGEFACEPGSPSDFALLGRRRFDEAERFLGDGGGCGVGVAGDLHGREGEFDATLPGEQFRARTFRRRTGAGDQCLQQHIRGAGQTPVCSASTTCTASWLFNVSCLTRMRPPVNYHQKHGGRAGATVVVRFARYETIP